MNRSVFQNFPHPRKFEKDFNFEKFSHEVHAKRWSRGYTCQSFGDIVGCSKATISRIERGKHVPNVPDFLFICYWLELNPMDYFQPIEEDMPPKETQFPTMKGVQNG